MNTEYLYALETQGFYKFSNVIQESLLKRMQNAVDKVLELNQPNVKSNYFYLAHNEDQSFLDFLNQNPIQKHVDSILSDTCIIHSYNAITLKPATENPIQNAIHRDSPRFCRPYLLSVQLILLLDDFTVENGATYVLPGSHHFEERPTDEFFYKNAIQLSGKAGDVILFDAMLWHAGGSNKTDKQRRAATLVYSRSFMKQQIDLTKATSNNIIESADDNLKRLLGFNVRVPSSMEEFNLPKENRLYKSNQG